MLILLFTSDVSPATAWDKPSTAAAIKKVSTDFFLFTKCLKEVEIDSLIKKFDV